MLSAGIDRTFRAVVAGACTAVVLLVMVVGVACWTCNAEAAAASFELIEMRKQTELLENIRDSLGDIERELERARRG